MPRVRPLHSCAEPLVWDTAQEWSGGTRGIFHFFFGLVPRSKTIFCFTQPKQFVLKRMNERVPSSQSLSFH